MVGAPVRRRQVTYLQQGGVSIRRACALMSVARSTLRYESRLAKRDAPVMAVMHELAAQYPRYGYRRIQVFLERRGHRMSADRAHRLWRQCGLQIPRRRPRRRTAAGRPRPLPATGARYLWAYDFVFDACANGQQLKCLTVIDEYTRECLAIDVAGSIRSSRVIEVLSKLVSVHGAPRYLRSDNDLSLESTRLQRTSATSTVLDGANGWIAASRAAANPRSSAIVRSPLTILDTRSGRSDRPCTLLKQREFPAEGPSIIYEVPKASTARLRGVDPLGKPSSKRGWNGRLVLTRA